MNDPLVALKACIERDADDLRRILRSYVVRMGLATVAEADEVAAEVMNDVVVAALSSADSYDTTRQPLPWLLGIGLNIIRSRLRNSTTRDVQVDDDDLLDALMAAVAPTHPAEANIWIEETLSRLSTADQQLVRLSVLHDLDSPTVARQLGITPGAVRVRLHRALKQLRAQLMMEERPYE